ncbi:hypothetical protein SNE40_011330 [Patella caerulea]|uniref:ENPP1-3/EXOG-like endonuclease/phosphodiesterase domain-containing protein n=1 Tax=Patella caerulea TaxID=87958 RepID=A0AAN8JPM6_PATCE
MKEQFDLENERQFKHRFSSREVLYGEGGSKTTVRKRELIIVIAVGVVIALALIIGLSVGLRKTENDEAKKTGQTYESKRLRTTTPITIKTTTAYKPTIVVSLGAVDFNSIDSLTNLNNLKKTGVSAKFLRPVYPTKQYPNTHSIVTGLYPESHGMIDDLFYDLKLDLKLYSNPRKTAGFWTEAEPIWNTAMKQGKTTAAYAWPGSNVIIQGMKPNMTSAGSNKKDINLPINTVSKWLKLSEKERPDLVFVYLESQTITRNLVEVDNMIGQFIQMLKDEDVFNTANMIVVSDHGLTKKSCENMVVLNGFLSSDELRKVYVYDGTFGRISNKYRYSSYTKNIPLNPTGISLEEVMSRVECRSKHVRINRKTNLPKRLHYSNNPRIDDIIVDVDEGWWFSRTGSQKACSGNDSGYDNMIDSMSAFFVAHGPTFKEGVEVEGFDNIELVNLISDIMNITPTPNNGTHGRLFDLMKNPPIQESNTHTTTHRICNNGPTCSTDHINDRRPALPSFDSGACVVWFSGSQVHAYSPTSKRFLWTSYYVPTMSVTSIYQDPDNTSCDTNSRGYLSPPSISNNEVLDYLSQIIGEYRVKYGQITVTAGPIYDYNSNGLLDDNENYDMYESTDNLVPTHHFVILSKCKNSQTNNCIDDPDVLSFILPHENNDSNCLLELEFLKRNVARLKDIELLTNFKFYSNLELTKRAWLQTYLPVVLWPSSSTETKRKPGAWVEEPCPSHNTCHSDYKPLIVISVDGFRGDYLLRNMTPVFQRLADCGVKVPYMRSAYPTKTFPNHYTIVTGLYPESHGIVDNSMYDYNIKERFSIGSSSGKDSRWWGGEPIWLTAKRQGKKSATFFWVGSDVKIQGEYPNIYRNFSSGTSFIDRVETAVRWLKDPTNRPDVLTLYFNEPDHAGHQYGPDSEKIDEVLRKMDNVIEVLMDELYQKDLHHCVNIMLLADHGMAPISCDKVNDLSTVFSSTELNQFYVYQGGFGRIAANYVRGPKRTIQELSNPTFTVDELKSRMKCHFNMSVYERSELPKRFHYARNDRIDSLILDNNLEYTLTRKFNRGFCSGGTHGYDNAYRSMGAVFIAHGPYFKVGYESETFENIELYNLMCDIIGVTPAPNNGTAGSLNDLLATPKNLTKSQPASVYKEARRLVGSSRSMCGQCDNNTFNGTDIWIKLDDNLNKKDKLDQTHLPFGAAMTTQSNVNVTILYQDSHITAYNTDIQSIHWISATINSSQISSFNVSIENCVYADNRVDYLYDICYNIPSTKQSKLLDVVNSEEFGPFLSTDSLPLIDSFRLGIWKNLQELVLNWTQIFGSINIVSGPIYDFDLDGIGDSSGELYRRFNGSVPVASHIFLLVTRCNISSSILATCQQLHTIAFILPHTTTYTNNCQKWRDYLIEHEGRVRDIEWLTHLQFFPDIQHSYKLRMYLPHGLWTN